MKKVLILSIGDLRHISMISMYTRLLKKENINYDIVCTSRYKTMTDSAANIYEFHWQKDLNSSKLSKIIPFLRFRIFAIDLIKKNKYDFIVVWNENTALLFYDILFFKFSKKYCINIRDFGLFKCKFFHEVIKELLNKSAFSTFPSPWGLEHLPKFDYTLMLNMDYDLIEKCKKKRTLNKTTRITITYLGLIFNTDYKRIILELGNDNRFLLEFFGPGVEEIEKLVKNERITNVIYGQSFPVQNTCEYLKNTDIINSYYGNSFDELKYAHGVKHSYAPALHLPIILDHNTEFGKVAEKHGFGFQIKDSGNFKEELYNWYVFLNERNFTNSCNEYVSFIQETNRKFENKFKEYIA